MEVEVVEAQAYDSHRMVFVDKSRAVWLTFARPWWDFTSWLWWFLIPGAKKWIQISQADGRKIRVRVVRLARDHNWIGKE